MYVWYGDSELVDVIVGPTQAKKHIRQLQYPTNLRILIANLRQHLPSQTRHITVHIPTRHHQIIMNLIIVRASHHSHLHKKCIIMNIVEVNLYLT
jgi:hypothetical protein